MQPHLLVDELPPAFDFSGMSQLQLSSTVPHGEKTRTIMWKTCPGSNFDKAAHKLSDGRSKRVRVDEAVDHGADFNGFIQHTVIVAKVEENDFILAPIRG